ERSQDRRVRPVKQRRSNGSASRRTSMIGVPVQPIRIGNLWRGQPLILLTRLPWMEPACLKGIECSPVVLGGNDKAAVRRWFGGHGIALPKSWRYADANYTTQSVRGLRCYRCRSNRIKVHSFGGEGCRTRDGQAECWLVSVQAGRL